MDYRKTREFFSVTGALICALAVAGECGVLGASEPLDSVPPNVAGIILIPNLNASLGRLRELGEKIDPSFQGPSAASLEERFGLKSGSCDFSRPVCLILPRPSFEDSTA